MVIGNNGLAMFPSTRTVLNEHIKVKDQKVRFRTEERDGTTKAFVLVFSPQLDYLQFVHSATIEFDRIIQFFWSSL